MLFFTLHPWRARQRTQADAERPHRQGLPDGQAAAQEAFDEPTRRLHKIASQIPGLIYQFRRTPDGHYTFPYASEAIRALYELSPEEARRDATRALAMIDPDDLPEVLRSIEVSAETLTPWHSEYRLHHSDGRVVWLEGQAIPERETDGGVLWHGFIHDVTERKQIEQMKSDFVSTVSHELRTPLTSINGVLGLAAGGALGELPEQAREMLTMAHHNARQLAHLLDDLLDMDKLGAGRMAFDLQERPLMALVEESLDANRAFAAQHRVSLVLVSRLDQATINVDATRFRQIMTNLLSNAIKFSPPGERVEVRVEAVEDRARVSVSDRGPGIPAAFRSRIFQKFSQANTPKTRHKGGTGLGLAITRELVERMWGILSFTSEEGQGTCFSFEFSRCDLCSRHCMRHGYDVPATRPPCRG
ncbi:PAS domain S-box-containing protein [Modicisalibacter ilicicola DSM 19980]|uniref:histidine kinase n=1 Tax=Modicisalibacter ilicicola DSM 19980 TaxID=1121942 RepID=A0A1M4TAH2_9GAMM|nr:HAMP domain-containing sensor histidine kinase [Halomonas ilicicola]SHE41425.1 PAS domain S-box-containing protein [Halomonas ilicicola DSM 19980]